jgi:hypothetical protein
MPNKKKSAKKTKFTKQAGADLAKLLKTVEKMELELSYVKQDFKRMMLWVHRNAPFKRRKPKRK